MTDAARAELERRVAERLAECYHDCAPELGEDPWLAVGREALAMCDRVAMADRTEWVRELDAVFARHETPIDLSAALEEEP